MNRKIKSLIVRAAVMAMIVGLLPTASTPVGAQEVPLVWSDTIVLTGATTALTCVSDCGGAANLPDMGGLGTYTFKVKTCEAQSDPGVDGLGGLIDVAPFDCNTPFQWTSPGSYSNTVCGTGTAHGFFGPVGPPGEVLTGGEYWIKFVGGLGVLTGNVTEVEEAVQYPASLTGTVLLAPLGTFPQPMPNCVTGFIVKATVHVFQAATAP